jgi:arylsulfatase A-like enzyme/Tfp pilus assembly protein PilF
VTLEDATVQAPQTRPSHASILTGRLPFEHGIRDNYSPPLDARHPTLASLLRGRGYDTAAFVASVVLNASSGLNRGFGVYDDPFAAKGDGGGAREERRASEVVDRALRWLARPRHAPFFAWVHLYDAHAPYEPPAPFARRYAERPYDGEVAYADAQLGRLLGFLDERGLRDRTLVVVTADHGEGLGEHGEDEHMLLVYDATLRVPLFFSWPGVLPAGARIAGQFRSVDLLATIVDLLGAPAVPTSGASRAAQLRSRARIPDNESYAESLYGQIHFGYAPLRALRAEGWKYVEAPRPELYDLRDDPGERRNLISARGSTGARLAERLAALGHAAAAPAPKVSIDTGTMERMAALGYLGASAARSGARAGADPKDKVQEVQSFIRDSRQAIRLFRGGDLDGALALLKPLARSEILSLDVQYFLGEALLRKRRYAEAAEALEQAVALLPAFTPASVRLSFAYAQLGQADTAMAVLERSLKLTPDDVELLRARGLLMQRRGDLAGAQSALEKARALAPRDARLRLALSAVFRDQGRLPEAVAEVREATRLEPASADAWNALGLLLVASGREAEGRAAFESGLKRRADDPDLLFNLAELHLRAGRAVAALPLLERVIEKAPSYPGAREALAGARRATAAPPPGTVHLYLVRVPDRVKAEELARRLDAGESFDALARTFSTDASASRGGDLGPVQPSELTEPLRSAAAALSPGAHSPILETSTGYVILERRP